MARSSQIAEIVPTIRRQNGAIWTGYDSHTRKRPQIDTDRSEPPDFFLANCEYACASCPYGPAVVQHVLHRVDRNLTGAHAICTVLGDQPGDSLV